MKTAKNVKTAIQIQLYAGEGEPEHYRIAQEDTGEVYHTLFALTGNHFLAAGLSAWSRMADCGDARDFRQKNSVHGRVWIAPADIGDELW